MSVEVDIHRRTLAHLAEMTLAMTGQVYAQAMGRDGDALIQAASVFADLGRGLRLTIALDLRLAAFNPATAEARSVARAETITLPNAATPAERRDRPERERETESESDRDGFPMDPLGRVQALERIITRNPTLDPDHKVSAEIIQLKAFLTGPEPPTPAPPRPPAARPGPPATLGRPLNRAERRRQRHASG